MLEGANSIFFFYIPGTPKIEWNRNRGPLVNQVPEPIPYFATGSEKSFGGDNSTYRANEPTSFGLSKILSRLPGCGHGESIYKRLDVLWMGQQGLCYTTFLSFAFFFCLLSFFFKEGLLFFSLKQIGISFCRLFR